MTNTAKAVTAQNVAPISNPLALIEKGMATGISPESLGQLLALQERFEANEARKQFYAAMHDFQAIKPELKRSSKVKFNTNKGTTEYNFCSLPDIEKALRGPLGECGLSYRFENFTESGKIGVRCIVSHVSGHSESTPMIAPVDDSGNKNGIQGIGSTSSYLMRYTLIAAFALTTADEDNDGQTQGDLPYLSLLKHNHVVRANLETIVAIKEAIKEGSLYDVAMYMDLMPADVKDALWLAPTKGGIFTTDEIKVFKTNEYANARADYFAEKQEQKPA